MTAKQNAVVCLDVGGTEIKAAAVGLDGVLLSPIHYFPADSGRGKEELLTHFAQIVLALARQVEGTPIAGVHLAFPGPFDYEKGISLMQGLDKYDALYGVDLRQELLQRLSGAGLEGLEGEGHSLYQRRQRLCLGGDVFRQCPGRGKGHVYLHRHRLRQRFWR